MPNPEFTFDPINGPTFKFISPNGLVTKELKLNNEGNMVIEGSEFEHNATKYEQTKISTEITTSSGYIDYPDLIISNPKAGTYLVVFSCVSLNSNNNGWSYIVIDKGGDNISHSERRMKGNKESSLSTVAVITVDGTENLKIKFRRDSLGSSEFSNANLVAVRIGD